MLTFVINIFFLLNLNKSQLNLHIPNQELYLRISPERKIDVLNIREKPKDQIALLNYISQTSLLPVVSPQYPSK